MATVNVTIFEGSERQARLKLESAAAFGSVKASDLPKLAENQQGAALIRVRGLTKRTTVERKAGGTAWSEAAQMNKDDVAALIRESNSAGGTVVKETVKASKPRKASKASETTVPSERETVLADAQAAQAAN